MAWNHQPEYSSNIFQPSFFRGYDLVFGGVPHTKLSRYAGSAYIWVVFWGVEQFLVRTGPCVGYLFSTTSCDLTKKKPNELQICSRCGIFTYQVIQSDLFIP